MSVFKVMTAEAPLLPGVTCNGENEQEEWLGNPEQERVTDFRNVPLMGVRFTVKLNEVPRRSDTLFGIAFMTKSTPVPVRPRF